MSTPKESDLRSQNHERFADAAMKCRHLGGFCIHDGYCHFDGDCFKTSSPKALHEKVDSLEAQIVELKVLVKELINGAPVQFPREDQSGHCGRGDLPGSQGAKADE